MNQIKLKALAKINLGLDVVRRREDGYHEVRMIMQTINLYDKVTIHKKREAGITVKTNLYFLPTDENNLVYKAAKLLMEEFHVKGGVEIELYKFIPVAAGMAGGSSDAAAVMYGVNRMFGLGLTTEELMKRGVKIGADVPYCIMRGTALAEGIGEKLTRLTPVPKMYLVIAKPAISVSTKFVYENLKLDEQTIHPDINAILDGIEKGDVHAIADNLGNVLESVTVSAYPVIDEIKQVMKEQGAVNALMSGSGPTVFGIFDKKAAAVHCNDILRAGNIAKNVYLSETYNQKE